MARIFTQHRVRKSIPLAEMWDLNIEGVDVDRIPVPCCIETNPKLISYKGKAMLKTEFEAKGNIRIEFSGVSHTALVSLDGKLIGKHYGAYGSFDYILKEQESGSHELQVEIDNSFHEEASLNRPNDYYSYGGITRPVVVEKLDAVYIRQIHFLPYMKEQKWCGNIKAAIVNLTKQSQVTTVEVELAGQILQKEVLLQPDEEKEIVFEQEFPTVEAYGPKNPKLYMMNVTIIMNGKIIDDYIDRIGFKEVSVEGQDILINGEKIIIKGFNRHEDYADYGCAVPLQAMYLDIELIKNMGANCIRTSHYPNDERFLDLCDENGILVWEEAHARSLPEEAMRHPLFMEQEKLSIYEMIKNHYNHPSIFVWGLLNESCDYTEFGRQCYKELIEYIKSLDNIRPVTYAACNYDQEVCFDLVDIVSLNMYPGWYTDKTTDEFLVDAVRWAESQGGAGKPMLVSEVGAGAIYGFRDRTHAKWSEERQEELLTQQLESILDSSRFSGVIIWQFCDCRVDTEWANVRPKTQNNKGVVDCYRREKLAYRKVKEIFEQHDR